MPNQLSNILKAYASSLDTAAGQVKLGTVTSVNSTNATARVLIQPEGVLSGWLPCSSQWIGDGWGMMCPPTPGDQVLLVPQEGDIEEGIILGRIFSTKQVSLAVPVGEFWLVHATGSSIKLCNDGTVRVTGDLHVAGDVYDTNGSLSRLRSDYDHHTHKIGPNGTTSLPTPTD